MNRYSFRRSLRNKTIRILIRINKFIDKENLYRIMIVRRAIVSLFLAKNKRKMMMKIRRRKINLGNNKKR